MIRPFISSCCILLLAAASAGAQMRRAPLATQDPDYWVGLSLGYQDGFTVSNGVSGNQSAFGYSAQIRATIEKTIQRGVSAGLSAGYSTAPLTYSPGFGPFDAACNSQCDAKADISQYLLFIRGGGGGGFHGLYSAEAGATSFSNYRERNSGTSLNVSTTYDFTFGFGGGFGYSLSPVSELYLSEMMDFVLHQQSSGTSQSAPRFFTVRAGMRYGF